MDLQNMDDGITSAGWTPTLQQKIPMGFCVCVIGCFPIAYMPALCMVVGPGVARMPIYRSWACSI